MSEQTPEASTPQDGATATPDQPAEAPAAAADPWADPESARREIEKLRKENATHRTKVKELTPKASRFDELEAASKTEAQRLQERAEAAERQLADVQTAALRSRVALTKGLPADLADRLQGATEDDLNADADALLALVANRPPTPPQFDLGNRGDAAPTGGNPMNAAIRRQAGRT